MRVCQVPEIGVKPLIANVETPQPKANEVLVQIAACSLNFADLLMIEGKYQDTPQAPFTLGLELAGTIVEAGANVEKRGVEL